ncbi:alpha/beta hydrolase [Nocardioides carbamazepini]|uniref:alpha/beta fold hydrolase n=1 Tax=Nocardioides carbamazepini TaxID=2854259 RepID=UPI00214A337C|nr:alpha/beta hydrolase [Nocardioides carbamazepini]MCR1784915.1 alpha/beta hydrolase [Nocardioides carbamazepini]
MATAATAAGGSGCDARQHEARFRLGLARSVTTSSLEVAGAAVAVRRWDNPGLHPVVLVHGGGAHARWWDAVAPHLTSGPVLALDLSGHGDSDHRPAYTQQLWVGEVRAVVRQVQGVPLLVGHSMGGLVAALLARAGDVELAGVVMIDSPINDAAPVPDVAPALGRPRRYAATAAEVEQRFRPILDSGRMASEVRAHVARHSVRRYDGGYGWKFDPAFHHAGRIRDVLDVRPACPVHYVRPTEGLATDEMFTQAHDRLGPDALAVIEMEGVGHNPMLDAPVELTAILRDVVRECG